MYDPFIHNSSCLIPEVVPGLFFVFFQRFLSTLVWPCCSGFLFPVFEEVAVLLLFFVLGFNPVFVVQDVLGVGVVLVLTGALVAGG
jgi:hypothetical protein